MTVEMDSPEPGNASRERWGRFRAALSFARKSTVLCVGLSILLLCILVAVFAPWIAPYPPNAQHMDAVSSLGPSLSHWLGADALHRDILSRIIWGARPVLLIAPFSLACAYIVGISAGLIAGYRGGLVDEVLSRMIDVLLSFPKIILYVVLIASMGASAANIVLAIALSSSPGIARLVRGLTLDIRTRDFVAAARTRGESVFYILLVEILPIARGPLIVDFCIRMGYTIIAIGVLGFLGLGLPPPDPDWGGMVRDATPMLTVYPHGALFPSLAIVTLVMAFNLIADGLQELDHER